MTNYPNMSYCAYENTVAALRQIKDDLNDSLDESKTIDEYREALESQHEIEAFESISYMCEDILKILANLKSVKSF